MNSRALGLAALVLLVAALFLPAVRVGNTPVYPVALMKDWGRWDREPGSTEILFGVAALFLAAVAGVVAVVSDERAAYALVVLIVLVSLASTAVGFNTYYNEALKKSKDLAAFFYTMLGPGEAFLAEALAAAMAAAALLARSETNSHENPGGLHENDTNLTRI